MSNKHPSSLSDAADALHEVAEAVSQSGAGPEHESIEDPTTEASGQWQHHHDDAESVGETSSSSFSVGLSIDLESRDADSDFGDLSRPPSSISATSSIYHYVEEFGRTYHKYKEGKYYLPNDEQEQSRLDLQHALARRVLDKKLYLAPIDRPNRVLDIGTGTGIWAIEFAEEHPESEVIGTDLSPIQPDYVPPNCKFEIDDVEDDWVYNHRFDYIHGRYICLFLKSIPDMLKNIYENLNPGGYVEIMETLMVMKSVDDSLKGHVLDKWNQMTVEGIKKIGRDPLAAGNLRALMGEAGFTNVTEKKWAVPVNTWAKGTEQKLRGAMMMTNILEAAQAVTMNIFTKVHGWTEQEVEVFLVDVRNGLKDKDLHAWIPILAVYGQKPE